MTIYNKNILSLLLLLIIGIQYPVSAQNDFCNIKNTSFKDGEKLEFKAYYHMSPIWIQAGNAVFNIKSELLNNQNVFHITGEGRTQKSYEWFYKVYDKYESYVDEKTLLPHKFVRNVNEGGFRIFNNVVFNQSIGQAVSTKGVHKVPSCVQDVLSAIYFARNIDYNKYQSGAKIPFKMFLDDEVYDLYIRYMGKETIETKYGKFKAIKIVPLLIEGTIFKGGEKMVIWVSDDANHIPLRIESPILVGSIKVDMMGYENLRNELTSLIKKK